MHSRIPCMRRPVGSTARLMAPAMTAGLAVLATAVTAHAATYARIPFFGDRGATANCGVTNLVTANKSLALLCVSNGGSFVLQAGGRPTRLVWHRPYNPLGGQPGTVLKPGSTWTWSGIRCQISLDTIACANRQRHGFTVGTHATTF